MVGPGRGHPSIQNVGAGVSDDALLIPSSGPQVPSNAGRDGDTKKPSLGALRRFHLKGVCDAWVSAKRDLSAGTQALHLRLFSHASLGCVPAGGRVVAQDGAAVGVRPYRRRLGGSKEVGDLP